MPIIARRLTALCRSFLASAARSRASQVVDERKTTTPSGRAERSRRNPISAERAGESRGPCHVSDVPPRPVARSARRGATVGSSTHRKFAAKQGAEVRCARNDPDRGLRSAKHAAVYCQ